MQKENERLQSRLKETEQAAIVAIRDKEVATAKQNAVKTLSSQDEQEVTEISKLKQQISELQVQLESSSNKGGVADQGGVANDAMREKLISTTVSNGFYTSSCHGDVLLSMNY